MARVWSSRHSQQSSTSTPKHCTSLKKSSSPCSFTGSWCERVEWYTRVAVRKYRCSRLLVLSQVHRTYSVTGFSFFSCPCINKNTPSSHNDLSVFVCFMLCVCLCFVSALPPPISIESADTCSACLCSYFLRRLPRRRD